MRPIKTFSALIVTLAITAACAASKLPEVTHDGLVLEHSKSSADVYRKPGASLADYEKYGLAPCRVAFKKNWMREQNRNRLDLSSRVTQKDVDRIKDTLSTGCDTYFREALEQDPAYTLVKEFDEGERVLVLSPAIINLDVAAPDVMSTSINRTYTTSAGEMTLLLEVTDATTNEALFRVVDRKRAPDMGRMQWTNSVTNKADANRALRYWAAQLRKALDSAHGL